MSLTAKKFTHVSAADYLSSENDGTWRHEFVNGAVFAMAGTSDRHNLIAGAFFVKLATKVKAPCQAFMADMKVHAKSNADERFYYPDVFVSCDEADRAPYYRETPVLIVEVLSPTTERLDRTEKFEAYKAMPSLMEYVLVSQDSVELELLRRRTNWQREHYVFDNVFCLESVDLTLSVSALFEQVTFS